MAFRNFRINVFIRAGLFVLFSVVAAWSGTHTNWQVTPFFSAFLAVVLIVDLVRYVENTNYQLADFLSFVQHRDFSTKVAENEKGDSFNILAHAYNVITGEFKRINREKAANHQKLQAVIDHVNSALFCIDSNNQIVLINEAAKKIFKVSYARDINSLARANVDLQSIIHNAEHNQKQLIHFTVDDETLHLSMFTTSFVVLDEKYTLFSLQNIKDELEMQEMDSWQKIIRVLTHEIMNSVTPIISLAASVNQTLATENRAGPAISLTENDANDLTRSLRAIEARSKGLVDFVHAYRDLANLPKPYLTDISIRTLFDRILALKGHDLKKCGICFELICDQRDDKIHADSQQIEQVLINLINNAQDALHSRNDGYIRISCIDSGDAIKVIVKDNGPGIAKSDLQKIFIPFYSTKPQGSGIGLSLSRQIVHANKATLSVKSEVGNSTEFTLTFRKH